MKEPNDLGKLASLISLPDEATTRKYMKDENIGDHHDVEFYHRKAKALLDVNQKDDAIKMAMIGELSH